jgi:hypothetical protein
VKLGTGGDGGATAVAFGSIGSSYSRGSFIIGGGGMIVGTGGGGGDMTALPSPFLRSDVDVVDDAAASKAVETAESDPSRASSSWSSLRLLALSSCSSVADVAEASAIVLCWP